MIYELIQRKDLPSSPSRKASAESWKVVCINLPALWVGQVGWIEMAGLIISNSKDL